MVHSVTQVLEQNNYKETSNFDNFLNNEALKEFREFNNSLKLYCDHNCRITNFMHVRREYLRSDIFVAPLGVLRRNKRMACR